MAASTALKSVLAPGCGTVTTTLLSMDSTKYAVILSMNITNVTEDPIRVTARIEDLSTGVYLFKDVEILPGSAFVAAGGEQKHNLYYNQSLKLTSDTAASADVLVSYSEITP